MGQTIDFWFSIGSTYTYLSVSRFKEVESRTGARFRLRPFNVRAIAAAMNTRFFADKPAKLAYMWRDVERRSATHGLPYRAKPPYSIADLPRPNRVALVGCREGWCEDYVRAAYRRWFLDLADPSLEPNLAECLREIGQDAERVIQLADSEIMVDELAVQTKLAQEIGIFGSPSFVVGSEIFWGDDRLDDAITWSRKPPL